MRHQQCSTWCRQSKFAKPMSAKSRDPWHAAVTGQSHQLCRVRYKRSTLRDYVDPGTIRNTLATMKRGRYDFALPATALGKRPKQQIRSPFEYVPRTPHNAKVPCDELDCDLPVLNLPTSCADKPVQDQQTSRYQITNMS